ncbi:MAG: TadE/TadG family type IV pilus assembly protein [Nocardioides sp.]
MAVRLRRSDRRDDRGAAAVEFALVLPFLLLIVFALIQYGLYFYAAQTGSNTVNAAARQLSVGNCQTAGSLQTFVDDRLGAASTANATIDPEFKNVDGSDPAVPEAANVEVGGTVKLTIEFQSIDLNFPFVPFLDNAVVYREVVARVEDTADEGCGA